MRTSPGRGSRLREPAPISLRDLVDELGPRLRQDGVSVAAFLTPDGRGVVGDVQALIDDLEDEEQEVRVSAG